MAVRKLPSFLNFNRSVSPSEGLLFGVVGEREVPVSVVRRGIRGSISSYSNVYKNDKADSAANIAKQLDPSKANLQEIDAAFLPHDADRLLVRFSLVVQAHSLAPSGCNDPEFYGVLKALSARYRELGGYRELAARYVWNLLNGRTLWRNRFVTDRKAEISTDKTTFSVASDSLRLDRFDRATIPAEAEPLVDAIAKALAGETDALFVRAEISGTAPAGAEVYPSQEFLPDGSPQKGKGKGKVLSTVSVTHDGERIRQGTLHAQKIGNAIRVIDDWHGQVGEYGVTAVEAFGYVQSRSAALRLPKGKAPDVFELLARVDEVADGLAKAASAEEIEPNAHYLMAMLVRGGVFSGEKAA